MGRPRRQLGVCETCGVSFAQKRRGRQRERRCPQCLREWRWSGHRVNRLRHGQTASREPGGLWPELVAAELTKHEGMDRS